MSEYLVRWKGYSEAANSWDPAANILDPDLGRAFELKQAALFEATQPVTLCNRGCNPM